MAHLQGVASEFYESSKLAKYPFEPYWPEKKLRICVTGAGGFIASHLAKRLKAEGHYIVGCDWKRNEHMPVRLAACHSRFEQQSWPCCPGLEVDGRRRCFHLCFVAICVRRVLGLRVALCGQRCLLAVWQS